MIHLFWALDKPMALDVGSGAVHMLDEIAFDALTLFVEDECADITEKLAEKYSLDEAEEVMEELHKLVEQGCLNTPDDYRSVAVHEACAVKAMCLLAAHDCNLRCQYCFAGAGEFHMNHRSLLSVGTGEKALDWLTAMSGHRRNLEVDFFGGEPLMNFSVIKQLVAYGRSLEQKRNKTFKFTLTTNGMALNDEIISFVNREMENVVISLDGRKEVHDRMRPTVNGKGSYDAAIDRARKLVEKRGHQRYYLRGTFTRYNLDFAEDVLHLAEEGFQQLSIEPVVAEEQRPYAIRDKDLPVIFAEYEKLGKEYVKWRRDGRWFNFFHFMVDLTGGPCLQKRLTGCGAGSEYVAVTTEGDIYPCHQFVGRKGMRMGSVLDGSFDQGLRGQFQQNHVLSKAECSRCWARFYCSGGCAANAHAFRGDIRKPYDMECQMEKKRLECAMAIYALEQPSV